MTIREAASIILEYRIEKDGWDRAIKVLDTSGKMTQRKLLEMIVMICKKLEQGE